MAAEMTLAEFWDLLNRHDWFYPMSDDSRVYRKGENSLRVIKVAAERGGPRFKKLFDDYQEHVFSGPAWNNDPKPRPPRPPAPNES